MEVSDGTHQPAVDFLRVGGPLVPGAQTGLHVAHGDFVVKRGQCPGEGGGGIAVDQNQVGAGLLQYAVHAVETLGGDGGQSLPGFHNVQIVVWL